MIFIISIAGYWFSQLSGLPQTAIIKWSEKAPYILMILFRALECTKCLCFWLGFIYALSDFNLAESVVYGVLTSFTGIVISRLYYKFLS